MNEQIEQVPLDLIDDPTSPMRTAMDEEKLIELMASIREHGIIQPVTLRKVGERYEVVAGHRRVSACKRIGLAVISSIVRVLDDAKTDEIRMHENLYREDINPVDEARYIRRVIDVHNVDPAELSRMTGKSEAYLRARYDLLDYPDYLIDVVEQEMVSLTAAQWLARITNDVVRKEYTRFAMIGGITAVRARAWYESWRAGTLPREASAFVPTEENSSAEPAKLYMPCVLCQHSDELDNLQMVYAHPECAKAVQKMQREEKSAVREAEPVSEPGVAPAATSQGM